LVLNIDVYKKWQFFKLKVHFKISSALSIDTTFCIFKPQHSWLLSIKKLDCQIY